MSRSNAVPRAARTRHPQTVRIGASRYSDATLRLMLWRAKTDPRLRDRALATFEPLVMQIASRSSRNEQDGCPVDDLAQEGRIALLRTLETADVPADVPVAAFVFMRVREAISHYSASVRPVNGIQVKVPRDQWLRQNAINKGVSHDEPAEIFKLRAANARDDMEIVDVDESPEELTLRSERSRRFQWHLDQLPDDQRIAITNLLDNQRVDHNARRRALTTLSKSKELRDLIA